MKRHKILRTTFIILALAGFSLGTFGQSAPEKINYQAIARDNDGNIMEQATIKVYFTIMNGGGNSVYEEEHSGITTNDHGLFSLAIGDGNTQSGTFSDIDWGSSQHMVKVEVDDGSGYTSMGTNELNSVPYSLYAEESGAWQSGSGMIYNENDKVGIGIADPQAPLDIKGGNWNLENSGGDLRIGGVDSDGIDNRLKVSMSTGGQGAGHARINAFGYSPQVRIGAGAKDILTVDSLGVGIRTDDNNFPRAEELHIVQEDMIGSVDKAISITAGDNHEYTGDTWSLGATSSWSSPEFWWMYNDTPIAYINTSGEWIAINTKKATRSNSLNSFSVLNKLTNLNPQKMTFTGKRGNNIKTFGFNANEIEKAFPSLVSTREGNKGLSYSRFSVLSIQAIKEQQEIIDNQKNQIEELQKELDEIKDALDEAGISVE